MISILEAYHFSPVGRHYSSVNEKDHVGATALLFIKMQMIWHETMIYAKGSAISLCHKNYL